MKLDTARLARSIALLAWAVFFDWLWLSGNATSFVGPRTMWVVPFGAIVLSGAAIAYTAGLRPTASPNPPSVRELLGLLALVAPILAVLVVPKPSLGALAVERKDSARAATSTQPAPEASLELDIEQDSSENAFSAIALVDKSPELGENYGVYDGARVRLLGLVSKAPSRPGERFEISRFTTSCCAADALPYTVRVRPAPGLVTAVWPTDSWLEVEGTVRRDSRGFEFVAERASVRDEPQNPYL